MGLLQQVVKNEAMKRDPPEIYGWRVILMACTACFGGMLFGMDTGTIGGVLVMDAFEKEFGLEGLSKNDSATLSANIVSALQAGCFLGAVIAWPLADLIGRKPSLLISPIVAASGIAMQAAASGHLAPMYTGRVVAGLGVGVASVAVPLYISENAPRAIRGLLTGLYQQFIVSGIMFAFWIDYGCLLHVRGNAVWIVPLSLQAVPAFFLFGGMLLCNETPRHLAKQDRWEESKKTLAQIRNLSETHPYVQAEFAEICAQLERERLLSGGGSFKSLQKEMWTVPGNRKRLLLSVFLMTAQQLTGVNAINYYAPRIFLNLGVSSASTSLFATGIYGVTKVVACAVFLLFAVDSLGRRKSLLWTAIGQGIVMYYIGLYVRFDPPVSGQPVQPAGYAALVCIYLFAVIYQFGWGPVCWIYIAEIPTVRLRSMNVAIAASTQWLFNFVVARATPNMLANAGAHGYGTYLIFGSFSFLMFVLTWLCIPETKGLFLEEMDDLFGIIELARRMLEEAELENGVPLKGRKSSLLRRPNVVDII